MADAVVGRDEELGSLFRHLERPLAPGGPVAVALEGRAGIGKSTLWRAALDEARARGLRVLSARPAEAERDLAHAGLGDLFEGALDDVLPELTPPQRHALEVALLLDDAGAEPVDARALGVAVRSALQLLAQDELVVAIDDLQWLDASTAKVLGFALRRLPEAHVLLVWTRRVGEGETSPVETALEPEQIDRVSVGPLSLGATQQIIQSVLPRAVPRPTLLRIHEASGGNPFYALELARGLAADEATRDPTQPLRVPERLEELVSKRLRDFTGDTRDALVFASAHARLTPAQLGGLGIATIALDPAVAAGVVELADGTVRFTHPLLASVLYQGLGPGERRRAHRRLAELVEEPLARARHLALSAESEDDALAGVLEEAAAAAAAQGAPVAAAELAEHALRLMPSDSAAGADRLAAAAARAHQSAGDVERARELAGEVLARAPAGAERAAALSLLAEIENEDLRRCVALMQDALLEPDAPLHLQASLHHRLSLHVRFSSGLDPAERHAQAAVELAEQVGDDGLRAAATAALALIRFNGGRSGAVQLAEQAYALLPEDASAETAVDVSLSYAHVLVWSMALERARNVLEPLHRKWSDRDERVAAYVWWYLGHVELRSGRVRLAAEYAERSRSVSALYARDDAESPPTVVLPALAAAQLGELERAKELAELACRLCEVHRSRLQVPWGTLGIVELWSGDARSAAERFATAEEIESAADGFEPNMCWWRAEQVEALLELGLVDDAVARLDAWEGEARRLRRRWALAHAARCRGLVAAARGEDALPLLEDAVAQHESVGDPFGRARALLALGTARRRARQKRPAREALEAALAGFEAIAAVRWADRARAELSRIGGRTQADGLTPAEQRVAELVAKGQTNAEVAAALFLAERTVASHLTHVYAKLGVRSRTELARRLQ